MLPGWQLALLRRRARRLVFDFDDAIFHRDSYHQRGIESSALSERFARTVKAADRVIAGNNFLAAAARRSGARYEKVSVIPTCVEPASYQVAAHAGHEDLRLAWIGSASTLQGLERTRTLWEKLGREVKGVSMRIIADRTTNFSELPVTAVRWSEETEAQELAAADIGVNWMPDDEWSRGKCGLKILQYQAAGLPVIANPVGVHREMVMRGASGFLPENDADWIESVRVLRDPALRKRMGSAGRASVELKYSTPGWSHSFVRAIVNTREPFAIEAAVQHDVPEVTRLIGRIFTEYGWVFEPAHELPDLAAFSTHYEAPAGAFFVCRDGNSVVGSVGVNRLGPEVAELHRLYVDQFARRRGVGRSLVDRAIEWCAEQGIPRLTLWSDTRFDDAHALYDGMGFTRTGERALDDANHSREYGFEKSLAQ